jgi:hypothetical protein
VGETSGQIENHIRDTREELSANLNELEQKVKSVTDWRRQYQKSPGVFLAAALGGGLLLAWATNARKYRSLAPPIAPVQAPSPPPKGGGELDASIGVIKSALIGLAAKHAKTALSELLPGFGEQLADQEKPKQNQPRGPMRSTSDASGNGHGNAMPGPE